MEEETGFRPSYLDKDSSGTVLEFTFDPGSRSTALLKRLNERGVRAVFGVHTAAGYASLPVISREKYPEWTRQCSMRVRVASGAWISVPIGYSFPHESFDKGAFDLANMKDLSFSALEKIKHKKRCIYSIMTNDSAQDLFRGEDDKDLLKFVQDQQITAHGAFFDAAATIRKWNDDLFLTAAGPGRKRRIVGPGIHLVTATMPAGEVLDISLEWGGGNRDRLYIVIQMRDAAPDLGRKTFGHPVGEIAQKISVKFTKDFVLNRNFLVESEKPHGPTEFEQAMTLQAAKDAATAKPDLVLRGLEVVKVPDSEQDVVALFHAMLAKGHLRGYDVLAVHGSSEKYDGVFRYKLEKLSENIHPGNRLGLPEQSFGGRLAVEFPLSVLEFKDKLHKLIGDFEDGSKSFAEIQLAVAWDIGDVSAFDPPSDYALLAVDHSTMEKQFYGETHVLTTTGLEKKLHVIILKELVAELVSGLTGSLTV